MLNTIAQYILDIKDEIQEIILEKSKEKTVGHNKEIANKDK